jgi:hypothetical protein
LTEKFNKTDLNRKEVSIKDKQRLQKIIGKIKFKEDLTNKVFQEKELSLSL